MQDALFHKALFERIEKIRKLAADRPDFTGFELAFDRGNISGAELAVAKAKTDRVDRVIGEETAQIEALAARYPAPFNRFLEGSIAKLRSLEEQLVRDPTIALAFEKRFTRALLPELIDGLEARRGHRKLRRTLPWLIWASVDILRAFFGPISGGSGDGGGAGGGSKRIQI
jgi:hypothetical protein